jgi:hypothetical protein
MPDRSKAMDVNEKEYPDPPGTDLVGCQTDNLTPYKKRLFRENITDA